MRRQSEHFARYRAAVESCRRGPGLSRFESRAEIARLVAQREASAPWPRDPDGAPLYPGAAKSLSPDQRRALIAPGALRAAARHAGGARACRGTELERVWRGSRGESGVVAARPEAWGDVILARKETPTSYHLSVVIDDALQGITEVVRGGDLFWSTSVHLLLQQLLGIPQPAYRHHRLIEDRRGTSFEIDASHGLARIARARCHAGGYSQPRRFVRQFP